MITDYPYIPESLDSITPISADLCGFSVAFRVARYGRVRAWNGCVVFACR